MNSSKKHYHISIKSVVGEFVHNINAKLFLYGYRLDDGLKGGDINLLLLLEYVARVAELQRQKYRLLVEFK